MEICRTGQRGRARGEHQISVVKWFSSSQNITNGFLPHKTIRYPDDCTNLENPTIHCLNLSISFDEKCQYKGKEALKRGLSNENCNICIIGSLSGADHPDLRDLPLPVSSSQAPAPRPAPSGTCGRRVGAARRSSQRRNSKAPTVLIQLPN